MSTRAVYTFKDERQSYAIYKHYDGYPSGAVGFIKNALGMSWGGGRFEASELAAAFVAANKKGAGDVYLTEGQHRHGDIDYDYVIYFRNELCIDAYEHCWGEEEKKRIRFYTGSFEAFYNSRKDPDEGAFAA